MKGITKEIQRKYKGNTKENKGGTKEIRRGYRGNTNGIQRKYLLEESVLFGFV